MKNNKPVIYLLVSLLATALFHAWLFAWYFPKHCLGDRRVSWVERYRAFFAWLAKKMERRGGN